MRGISTRIVHAHDRVLVHLEGIDQGQDLCNHGRDHHLDVAGVMVAGGIVWVEILGDGEEVLVIVATVAMMTGQGVEVVAMVEEGGRDCDEFN